jgi:hypothetical protein
MGFFRVLQGIPPRRASTTGGTSPIQDGSVHATGASQGLHVGPSNASHPPEEPSQTAQSDVQNDHCPVSPRRSRVSGGQTHPSRLSISSSSGFLHQGANESLAGGPAALLPTHQEHTHAQAAGLASLPSSEISLMSSNAHSMILVRL